MQIFTKPNFNFIRWRWHAIALSLVVIAGRRWPSCGPRAACRSASTSRAGRSSSSSSSRPSARTRSATALDRMPRREGRPAVRRGRGARDPGPAAADRAARGGR
ncbi:MAG: hypothetical protein M0C28_13215 [Candidatus Moduliflexus flocculans]|nr:hypothetical protein [Candidatus Moduliflexus flocculans]